MLLSHTLAQVFQHGKECRVQCLYIGAAIMTALHIIVLEFLVGYNHERFRSLQIALSGCSELQQAIVLYVFLQITRYQRLANHRVPYLGIHILACTKLLQLVVLVRYDIVGATALHEVNDILLSEVLLHGSHRLQYNHQGILRLKLLSRMQTVVAVVAVLHIILLTEIMQQHLASAHRRLGVCRCFLQELSADILLCHRLVLHKLLQLSQVLACIESNADAFASVASRTSGLLIIAFQTLRNIIVNNKSYIRLVNAHTEGDGSHNHVETLHQEVVLGLRTGG